jgi:tetratricopeptide (TPR) repeat protein
VKIIIRSAAALVLLLGATAALADGVEERTSTISARWAQIKYKMPTASQIPAMDSLKQQADALVAGNPRRAEPLIWDGIVTSTLAGLKGGMGALSLCKEARSLLERAEKIDANALDGSAHTSLGALYYQVPGWPIGFGDKSKAREELLAGLRVAPRSIDANYFWGDYLYKQGQYAEAVKALRTAMSAAPRPGREVADAGRRGEIQGLLAAANAKSGG